jgi:prepilin-type N-terminal cleavage/methylation domain-containing protein
MSASGQRGFSLPEVLIVAVITGVLTSMAVPKLTVTFQGRAVATAADQFVLAHSMARSTALRYGRMAQLHIDTVTARFWVDVDTSGTGQRDTIGLVHDVATQGVRLSGAALLCFDARGLAATGGTCQSGATTVVFREGNSAASLQVTTLGKVLR